MNRPIFVRPLSDAERETLEAGLHSPSTADCDDIDPYARQRHTPRCDYDLLYGYESR